MDETSENIRAQSAAEIPSENNDVSQQMGAMGEVDRCFDELSRRFDEDMRRMERRSRRIEQEMERMERKVSRWIERVERKLDVIVKTAVQWFKGADKVEKSDNIKSVKSGNIFKLDFKTVEASDAGQYTVKVIEDKKAISKYTASLNVLTS